MNIDSRSSEFVHVTPLIDLRLDVEKLPELSYQDKIMQKMKRREAAEAVPLTTNDG